MQLTYKWFRPYTLTQISKQIGILNQNCFSRKSFSKGSYSILCVLLPRNQVQTKLVYLWKNYILEFFKKKFSEEINNFHFVLNKYSYQKFSSRRWLVWSGPKWLLKLLYIETKHVKLCFGRILGQDLPGSIILTPKKLKKKIRNLLEKM